MMLKQTAVIYRLHTIAIFTLAFFGNFATQFACDLNSSDISNKNSTPSQRKSFSLTWDFSDRQKIDKISGLVTSVRSCDQSQWRADGCDDEYSKLSNL